MRKSYEIIFQDEYNNLILVGHYKKLKDCYKDVNPYLSTYTLMDEEYNDTGETVELGKNVELQEVPGTYGPVFDKIIDVPEGSIGIRGFVLYE